MPALARRKKLRKTKVIASNLCKFESGKISIEISIPILLLLHDDAPAPVAPMETKV